MSKSYRKPWGTFCNVKSSEHYGKTICSRNWRRAQNQAVREALRDDGWDEFILPPREAGKFGTEYDLRRDGHKRPYRRSRQYNNPYAYVWSRSVHNTEEEIFAKWRERQEHDDWFIKYASRK